MKVMIDPLTHTSGWTISDGLLEVTNWPEYSASGLANQFQVLINSGGTLDKTFTTPINISGYNQIRFNAIGRESDFNYTNINNVKLRVRFHSGNNSEQFIVPLTKQFQPITFQTSFTSISRITFSCTSRVEFFISEIIAYREEMPIDLIDSIKKEIESLNTHSLQIGTVSGSIGQTEITISNMSYINKYTCIKIGQAIHQVKDVKGNRVTFFSTYSGRALTGNYDTVPVYLHVPCSMVPDDIEAIIPGIAITNPFYVEKVGEEFYSYELDSIMSDKSTVRVNLTGNTWKYEILLEGLAREPFIMQILFNIIKKFIDGKRILWVNGNKVEYTSIGVQQIEYGDANELLTKINCILEITYTEETWENQIQTQGFTVTKTVVSEL